MSWSDRLVRPVVPPKGKPIVTLSDARQYILKLPKDRQSEPIVQEATRALMMVADGKAPDLLAQSAVAHVVHGPIKLLNRKKPDRPWLRRSRKI